MKLFGALIHTRVKLHARAHRARKHSAGEEDLLNDQRFSENGLGYEEEKQKGTMLFLLGQCVKGKLRD